MEEKRNLPLHSVIFDFWKDLCITPYGEIVHGRNKCKSDEYILIDYYEPKCWCCGKYIDFGRTEEQYYKILNSDKPHKVWDMPVVKSHLNRCHIIPFALGGSDDPSNLFLMCKNCHKDSPDITIPKYFFKYIYEKRKNTIFGFDRKQIENLCEYFKILCETYNKDINYFCKMKHEFKEEIINKVCSHGGTISYYSLVSAFCDALPDKKCVQIKYHENDKF